MLDCASGSRGGVGLNRMMVVLSAMVQLFFCLSGVGMTVPSLIEMYVSLLRLGLEQGD